MIIGGCSVEESLGLSETNGGLRCKGRIWGRRGGGWDGMAAVVVRVRLPLEKVPHSVSPCLLLLKRGTPEKLDYVLGRGQRPGPDNERESVAPGTRGGLSDRWRPEIHRTPHRGSEVTETPCLHVGGRCKVTSCSDHSLSVIVESKLRYAGDPF